MGNIQLEDNGLRGELQRNLKIKNNKSVTKKTAFPGSLVTDQKQNTL